MVKKYWKIEGIGLLFLGLLVIGYFVIYPYFKPITYPLPIISTTLTPDNNCQFELGKVDVPTKMTEIEAKPLFYDYGDLTPQTFKLGCPFCEKQNFGAAVDRFVWKNDKIKLSASLNFFTLDYLSKYSTEPLKTTDESDFITQAWEEMFNLELNPENFADRDSALITYDNMMPSDTEPNNIEQAELIIVTFTKKINGYPVFTPLPNNATAILTFNRDLTLYSFKIIPFETVMDKNLRIKSKNQIKKDLEAKKSLVKQTITTPQISTCDSPQIEQTNVGYYFNPDYSDLLIPSLEIKFTTAEAIAKTAYLSLVQQKETATMITQQYFQSLTPYRHNNFYFYEEPKSSNNFKVSFLGENPEISRYEWEDFLKVNKFDLKDISLQTIGF